MRVVYVTAIRAINDSIMVAIPKALLESLNLIPDMLVNISVAEGRLIVDPRRRPRYRLAELVRQCDASAKMTDEDRAWLDDAAIFLEDA